MMHRVNVVVSSKWNVYEPRWMQPEATCSLRENKGEHAQACDARLSITREESLRLQNTKQMKRCIIFQEF